MDINDHDLYGTHDRLVCMKKQTYDKIYQKCIQTIKLASKSGHLSCVYYIPSFLVGGSFPIIDIERCAEYVMSKLEMNANIKTEFYEPNIIVIDWSK